MSVEVTARHMHDVEAIQKYGREKGDKIIKEFSRVEHVHIILNVEKHRHIAEIVVQAKSHIRVEAEESSRDMRVSIDGAIEKAQKQLRRLRDKIQDHKTRMKHVAVDRVRGVESNNE